MSAVYTIANVQHALQALKELIPPEKWADTPLPVIAAPGAWLQQVAAELGAEEGMEPAEIHGCSVIRKDDLAGPVLIDHDGKTYSIEPAWLKAKAEADSEGGEA